MANRLDRGEWLRANESITSPNGRFSLIMQDDANLVLYEMSGGVPQKALWSSQTNSGFVVPSGVVMQSDANLVVYRTSGGVPQKALWSSGTNQGFETDCFLELQDDGVLVLSADVPDEEGRRGMGEIWSAP